jgi:quercetin dioxygenase-like cupin family protein
MQKFLPVLLALAALANAQPKPEIDNPWVRVWRVKLAPHEKVPRRHLADSVVVYLTAPHAGEVAWRKAGQYAEENSSGQPVELIVTELKSPVTDQRQPVVTLDPVTLDPPHHLVPFENARVRVLHTILEPHLKSPMHEHPHYVVVYITELHTTMVLGDGKAVDNPRHPGEIAWRDFMKHETENLGDRTAVEIQIELK